jgi:hypothetical protein
LTVDHQTDVVDDGVAVELNRPVSGSTSTSQMWQPFGKLGTSAVAAPAPCNPTPSSRGMLRNERHLRDLLERHRPVGAGDRELGVGERYVSGVGLHEMRVYGSPPPDYSFRDFYEPFLNELCRSRHRIRIDLDTGEQIIVSPVVSFGGRAA